MASYRLLIKKSAQKEIRKLPSNYRIKIINRITALEKNPLTDTSEKIKGLEDVYRIRYGVYRIVYSLQKSELVVVVVKVSHRKDSYKNLQV